MQDDRATAPLPALKTDDLTTPLLQLEPLKPGQVLKTQINIQTPEQYEAAAALHLKVKERRKEWKAEMDPIVAARRLPWQEATDHRADGDGPLEAFEKALGAGLVDFNKRQEEERKRLQAEANRKAEEEAERLRLEAVKKAEDEKIARAEAAEKAGNKTLAERILTAPATVVRVAAPRAEIVAPASRPAGLGFVNNWKYEIPVDPELRRVALFTLVEAAFQDPDRYLDCIDFNEKTLDNRAKDSSGQAAMPGLGKPVNHQTTRRTR